MAIGLLLVVIGCVVGLVPLIPAVSDAEMVERLQGLMQGEVLGYGIERLLRSSYRQHGATGTSSHMLTDYICSLGAGGGGRTAAAGTTVGDVDEAASSAYDGASPVSVVASSRDAPARRGGGGPVTSTPASLLAAARRWFVSTGGASPAATALADASACDTCRRLFVVVMPMFMLGILRTTWLYMTGLEGIAELRISLVYWFSCLAVRGAVRLCGDTRRGHMIWVSFFRSLYLLFPLAMEAAALPEQTPQVSEIMFLRHPMPYAGHNMAFFVPSITMCSLTVAALAIASYAGMAPLFGGWALRTPCKSSGP